MHHIHRASFILLLLALLAPCSALAADIDDPDWKDPGIGYMGANYLLNLEYALEGNAKAMVNLAVILTYWRSLIARELTDLPQKEVLDADFWRTQAEEYTSKGWRFVREGDADRQNRDDYRAAAEAGNAEGMYKYANDTIFFDKACKYMTESAAMGNPDALFTLAEDSLQERSTRNVCKKRKDIPQYIDLMQKAASAGSPNAFIHLLTWYYNGEFVATKADFETAAMYLVLASHFAQGKDEITRDDVEGYSGIFPAFPPEVQLHARERADAWLKEYNAPRQTALEAERERRKPLTMELRKELADVVTWLEELQRQGR